MKCVWERYNWWTFETHRSFKYQFGVSDSGCFVSLSYVCKYLDWLFGMRVTECKFVFVFVLTVYRWHRRGLLLVTCRWHKSIGLFKRFIYLCFCKYFCVIVSFNMQTLYMYDTVKLCIFKTIQQLIFNIQLFLVMSRYPKNKQQPATKKLNSEYKTKIRLNCQCLAAIFGFTNLNLINE